MMGGPTIAAAMKRPYDNFALLRLFLALSVVVSHAFSVATGTVIDEPLFAQTGFTLGEHAVNGFFAISGFLVTMSFLRRGWRDYALARALRIAPAFVVAVLATAFLLGPIMTTLPQGGYWNDERLWRFVSSTLFGFKSTAPLPGVFENHPYRSLLGTVWTLKYEVICYAGVLFLGIVGLLRSKIFAAALVFALAGGLVALDLHWPDAPKGIETAIRLPLLFAAGGMFYLWRDLARLRVAALGALAVAAYFAHGTFVFKTLLFLTEAYGVLWLALAPGLSHPRADIKTDLSYGSYLLGWPVQQTLFALFPAVSPVAMLPAAILVTLALAYLSWRWVERPALDLKARLLARPISEAALSTP